MLFSRRSLLALGAALALPEGCVPAIPSLRDVDLDALNPNRVLLLGRIHLTLNEMDRTGEASVSTDAKSGEMPLPPDGELVWVVQRIRWMNLWKEVQLGAISCSGKTFVWTRADKPLLAPVIADMMIFYFGTIRVTADSWKGSALAKISDDHGAAMPAFVAQNPRLAGRRYYNVPAGQVMEAPLGRRG